MDQLETPYRIEPCMLEETSTRILDLTASIFGAAQKLGNHLASGTAASLAGLVCVMNCYYSNLIEGHNTLPRDIERALADQLDEEDGRRNLQLEARAHITAQRLIELWYQEGRLPEPASLGFIRSLHEIFYTGATPRMLEITGADSRVLTMTPGQFRNHPNEDVQVGRHQPPSAPRVGVFMEYFEKRYALASLGAGQRTIAMAAAHHRFNYIHPFLDGNGRVSRLISHAMALQAGIGAHGLWSISRGLARSRPGARGYMSMMNYADMPRQGDLDGRGNLSLKALQEFTEWFLEVCLDQITFMSNLFQLGTLQDRLTLYVVRRELEPATGPFLHQVLHRGEVPRGEVGQITGLKERRARDLLAGLVADGIIGSRTPKGPVSLRFPIDTVEILFPALFPEITRAG